MFSSILAGFLGGDAVSKTLPNGSILTTFSIADGGKYTDKNGEERGTDPTWFRVTCWNSEYSNLATNTAKLLKGSFVVVEFTKIKAAPYIDKSGAPAASLEVTARAVTFGPRPTAASSDTGDSFSDDDIAF